MRNADNLDWLQLLAKMFACMQNTIQPDLHLDFRLRWLSFWRIRAILDHLVYALYNEIGLNL